MFGQIKRFLNRIRWKKLYPNAILEDEAYISLATSTDAEIYLGQRARLTNCEIKNQIKLERDAHVDNCIFHGYNRVCGSTDLYSVELGRYSYVSWYSYLTNVKVGSFCSIGPFCKAGWGKHPTKYLSSHPIFYSAIKRCGVSWIAESIEVEHEIIHIGNDVWIGTNVILLDGVQIGTGSIIAAGSVVTKDVPPYSIVGGVPAKIIRMRFSNDMITKLLESEWWNMPENVLKENIEMFQMPAERAVDLLLDLAREY